MKALNGVTLAEGIEEQPEAEVCQELGFELAQGFYYGRPMTVTSWLENHARVPVAQKSR